MMTTNKAAMLTLLSCLSNLTVHGMDKLTHTVVSHKKAPQPIHNPNAQKRRSDPRILEREKTMQLNRDRNKKLYRYLSSDDHL